MSIFKAILPTHAAMLGLMASQPQAHNPLVKYVIVTPPGESIEHVIIVSAGIQHSHVVPAGYKAVSAGFILRKNNGTLTIPDIPSESLRLGPRAIDPVIIAALFTHDSN